MMSIFDFDGRQNVSFRCLNHHWRRSSRTFACLVLKTCTALVLLPCIVEDRPKKTADKRPGLPAWSVQPAFATLSLGPFLSTSPLRKARRTTLTRIHGLTKYVFYGHGCVSAYAFHLLALAETMAVQLTRGGTLLRFSWFCNAVSDEHAFMGS